MPHKLVKSISTPHFNKQGMATTAMPSRDDGVVDTRTPSPIHGADSSGSSTTTTTDAYKPDLSAEVTMLSTKLVNALNYQTNLDDALQASQHELEQSRQEVTRLREQKQEWDALVASGAMVKKDVLDTQVAQLTGELARERGAREEAEKVKRQTEGELESLTTALFEEANTMVAAARKENEAIERRNSQLRGQLNDTELLLGSQQEQLKDLKECMEKMERASDYEFSNGGQRDPSVPTTPINATSGTFENMFRSGSVGPANVTPEHPLYFSQLLLPIMRHDLVAYNEFQDLLQLARRGMPHSRNNSNNTNSFASSSQTNIVPMTSSSPVLPGSFTFAGASSPQTTAVSQAPPLKDSKFYKRVLLEDLEPTLRLDTAPGLSFLSRRTVLSSLLLGTLIAEPFLPQTKFYGPLFACSLCGESRKTEPYIRKHRFRTSEEESAQRYPLCDYCLTRVRAAGDFVGFLRMVRDGHWRAETEDEQNSAWDESVRLRERMFWARLGGGVVPVTRRDVPDSPSTTAGIKSQRTSFETTPSVVRSPSKLAMVENAPIKEDENGVNDDDEMQATEGKGSAGVVTTSSGAEESKTLSHRASMSNGAHPIPVTAGTAGSPATDDASTPFEDAQTSNQDGFNTAAAEQLQREATATAEMAAARPTSRSRPPSTISAKASSRSQSPIKQASEALRSQQTSPSHERQPSAVLARVKAMEAKAKAKGETLPGAFE